MPRRQDGQQNVESAEGRQGRTVDNRNQKQAKASEMANECWVSQSARPAARSKPVHDLERSQDCGPLIV